MHGRAAPGVILQRRWLGRPVSVRAGKAAQTNINLRGWPGRPQAQGCMAEPLLVL
jgi:hypothetical protein